MRGFPSSHRVGYADSQSQFFYTNVVYDQAYKAVSSALRAEKGLILLTGDAGTGKTKLMGLNRTPLDGKC
jgi:type II secretory ATPase GspE/PulE/Tfp pilus assembly ATPase PilB-like protein